MNFCNKQSTSTEASMVSLFFCIYVTVTMSVLYLFG